MGSENTTEQQSLPQRLLTAGVKHAALLFGVVYAAGFLVSSLYQAHFGLDTLEPLKAKVFSAGILFVVLALISCVAMARLHGLFGLRRPGAYVVTDRVKIVKLIWALDFWWVAVGLRIFSSIVFAPFEMYPAYPGWLFYLLFCAAWATANQLCDLNTHPVRTVLIEFVFFVFGVALIYRYMSHRYFVHVIWFYLVGLTFLWLYSVSNSVRFAETHDWERDVFFILALILFFANYVYRDVYSFYGGGKPVSVDLIFVRPTSFSSSLETSGLLVDQDSYGYYLIHTDDERSAVFVPRDAISGIIFHGNLSKF